MNKNKIILLIIFSIVLVICLVIGATYAYWSRTIVSENNLVLSGCFNITFTNESNDISLNRAYPLTNEEANNLTPYSFRVTNSCNVKAKYNINLETLTGSTLDTNLLNVSLSSDTPKRLGSLNAASTQLDNGVSSNTLVEGILKPGKSIDYNLRVWLPSDITNEQGQNKSWNGKVVLNAVGTDEIILADLQSTNDFTATKYNAGYGNTLISSLEVTDEIPQGWNYVGDVSTSTSNYPIYLYITGNDAKLYTEAEKISFNEDSSSLFVWDYTNLYLTSLDLSKFNFSKVVNASQMFMHSYITNLDFTNQDMSNVKDMSNMFYDSQIESITGLETSKVESVENISGMLRETKKLTSSIDLSNWNVSNLRETTYPFASSKISNLTLDNWDLSSFEQMTISGMSELNKLSLRNAKFTNKSQIWNNTLKTLDITGADFSNVTEMQFFFSNLGSLEEIIGITNIDTSNVTKMAQVFYQLNSLKELDLSGWDTSSITGNIDLFSSSTVERLILDGFDFRNNSFNEALGGPSGVKYLSLRNAIDGSGTCRASNLNSSVEIIDMTGFDISRRTSLSYMFLAMKKLKQIIGIEDLDVSNITDFSIMFCQCESLEFLDLSRWNMSNATNLNTMFAGARLINGISFMQNWDVSNVTNFSQILASVNGLTDVSPINNWNINTSASFDHMLNGLTLSSYPTWDGTWDTSTGTFTPNNA